MTQQFTREFMTWLDQTLQSLPYRKADIPRIRTDVLDVMQQTGSLNPTAGGTVPIFFQSRQYNTPVQIWIPETYPLQPPVCYVVPTPGMVIKGGHRNVDQHGVCFLPYLHEWKSTSNLTELVGHMSSVFGQDPPLRSVPTQPTPAPPPPPPPGPYPGSYYPSYPPAAYPPQPTPSYAGYPSPAAVPPPLPPRPAEDPDVVAKRALVQNITPRLQRELEEFRKRSGGDLEEALATQRQLEDGERQIQQQLTAMQQEKSQLERNRDILQQKCEELNAWLRTHERTDEQLDVEASTEPKDPLAKQLLHVIAADQALSDGFHVLDRALQCSSIDLPTFLKQVRFLAEEQFEKRALRHRITAALQQAVAQQQQQQMMQQPFGTQQPPAGYRPADYPAQPPQIGGYSYGPSGIPYGSS